MDDCEEASGEHPIPLPKEGKRNILVVANALSSAPTADVFARYCRARGYNVLFVSGAKQKETLYPHKPLFDWFNISFDIFGCTSTMDLKHLSHQFFLKLHQNGLVTPATADLFYYCRKCVKYLPCGQVEGECPSCSTLCKGDDQCPQCGLFMKVEVLNNPRCTGCMRQSTPIHSGQQLFLQLPSVKDEFQHLFKRVYLQGVRKEDQLAKQLHNQPCCLTQNRSYGGNVVPLKKFKDKTLLKWFSTPLEYIAVTKCHTSDWEQWWKNPENVELHQFMVEEMVPLYAVQFPSVLVGTRERWTPPRSIYSTKSLLFETEEMANSYVAGFFDEDVKQTGIPVEVWRYYLLSKTPEVSDGTKISWDDLQAKLNCELVDNLGNLIHNVLAIIVEPLGNGYGSIIPCALGAELEQLDVDFTETIYASVMKYINALEKGKMKKGLEAAMQIGHAGNQYFQRNRVRELYKKNSLRCSFVIKILVGVVCVLACLLEPFMPSFTEKVLEQLNLPLAEISVLYDVSRVKKLWDITSSGHKIGTTTPLFRKLLGNKKVEALKSRFPGYTGKLRNGFVIYHLLNRDCHTQKSEFQASEASSGPKSCTLAGQTEEGDIYDPITKQPDRLMKGRGSGASTCGASFGLRKCSLAGEPKGDEEGLASNQPHKEGQDGGSLTSGASFSLRRCSSVGEPKGDEEEDLTSNQPHKKGQDEGSLGTEALENRSSRGRRNKCMDAFANPLPKKRKRLQGTEVLENWLSRGPRNKRMDACVIPPPSAFVIPPPPYKKWELQIPKSTKSTSKRRVGDGHRDYLMGMLRKLGTISKNLSVRAEKMYYSGLPLSTIFCSLEPNRVFSNLCDASSVTVTMKLYGQEIIVTNVRKGFRRWRGPMQRRV